MLTKDVPDYRIKAVEYARRTGTEAQLRAGGDPNRAVELSYFVFFVEGGGKTVIVDLGFTADAAEKRGREPPMPFETILSTAEVQADAIEHAIVTHLHWDHAGNHQGLTRAQFYLQDKELLFWTGSIGQEPAFSSVVEDADIEAFIHLGETGRLTCVAGSAEIAPGIHVHLTGGHSQGLQVVTVAMAQGTAVIASDAVLVMENYARRIPDPFPHCAIDVLQGYRLIARLKGPDGIILPGHDCRMDTVMTPCGNGLFLLEA